MAKISTIDEPRGQVRPLLERHGLRAAWAFGSFARGEAQEGSDIDILVDGGASFRPISVYAFGEELRSASGRGVDVLEMSELDEGPFRDAVTREAVAL